MLDLGELKRLRPGPDPQAGYLFLAGTTDGEPWYFVIRPGGGECFAFNDRAIDRVDEVLFSFGLLLPKADDFDDPGLGGLAPDRGLDFCITQQGEVAGADL